MSQHTTSKVDREEDDSDDDHSIGNYAGFNIEDDQDDGEGSSDIEGSDDDELVGDLGDDNLDGGIGDDFLSGEDGDDNLIGDIGNDDINGGNGNDTLSGGDGDDLLYAASGNDMVDAGAGNDLIIGGDGAGNDVFKFQSVSDTLTATSRDVISDFSAGDKIDLAAIDAISGTRTNDAFKFIGSSATLTAVNANGALWFENGVLYGSNDKDLAAEFQIELTGVTTLSVADFVL